MTRRGRAALPPALMGLAALLFGAAPVGAADEMVGRIQIEQKLHLVAKLLSDSPVAQRIASSGNAQALAHLDQSRVHHSLAEDRLARGELDGARREADDALRHLGAARKLVPDAPAREAAARQRHEQLSAGVEKLFEAWRARAGTQAGVDNDAITLTLALLGAAQQQAGQGRHDEANQTLLLAERQVLAGLNRSLHATTLDYTLRAASPAEAYQQELSRHRALADLLPVALRDLQPRAEQMAQIERYADTAVALQTQAQQRAQAGDSTAALTHIRNATLYMQRALAAAGVAAVAPTGSSP